MFKCSDVFYVATSILIDGRCINTKKIIEEKIECPMSFDHSVCSICYEQIMSEEIFCRICKFIQCVNCFYKILRQNKGIHICPQCRYTFDRRRKLSDPNT